MVRCSIRAAEQLCRDDDLFGENKSPQTKGFYRCDPEGIRTPDPQLRRLLLYPAELPDLVHDFLVKNLGKGNTFLYFTQKIIVSKNAFHTQPIDYTYINVSYEYQ